MQENLPSSKIIYMRRTGKYGSENYKLMDTFKKWIQENDLYNEDTVIYAIPMDNPEIVDPFQCRYDVCIKQPTIYKFAPNQRGRKIFCVYGEKSSLIRTRYV